MADSGLIMPRHLSKISEDSEITASLDPDPIEVINEEEFEEIQKTYHENKPKFSINLDDFDGHTNETITRLAFPV